MRDQWECNVSVSRIPLNPFLCIRKTGEMERVKRVKRRDIWLGEEEREEEDFTSRWHAKERRNESLLLLLLFLHSTIHYHPLSLHQETPDDHQSALFVETVVKLERRMKAHFKEVISWIHEIFLTDFHQKTSKHLWIPEKKVIVRWEHLSIGIAARTKKHEPNRARSHNVWPASHSNSYDEVETLRRDGNSEPDWSLPD